MLSHFCAEVTGKGAPVVESCQQSAASFILWDTGAAEDEGNYKPVDNQPIVFFQSEEENVGSEVWVYTI